MASVAVGRACSAIRCFLTGWRPVGRPTQASRLIRRPRPGWWWAGRQLQVLEVGPQIVDRVELGGIGGQPLGTAPVALAVQPGPHPGAPVGRQPIPDEHDSLAGGEAGQLLKHGDAAVGVIAGLLQLEAPPGGGAVRPVAQGGGHGGLLPAEPVPQHGCGAPGRPGKAHRWDQRDGRFARDDEPGATPARLGQPRESAPTRTFPGQGHHRATTTRASRHRWEHPYSMGRNACSPSQCTPWHQAATVSSERQPHFRPSHGP
jgi:hypothetical protein